MTIVDSHVHLGICRVFNLNVEEADLIKTMDENDVQVAIVQPFPGAPDAVDVHNRIASLAEKHPGRIYGVASITPHMDRNAYFTEIRRCIEELGFVGIKMHTIGHAVLPLSPDGAMVFEAASEFNVPVQVHTGPGVPFALPSLCIPLVNNYPTLKVVLAHSGFSVFSAEAYVVAKECPNVYLETSWCMVDDIELFINDLGSGRVMMGSDGLANLPIEIAKYRSIGLNEAQLNDVLVNTAFKVYGIA